MEGLVAKGRCNGIATVKAVTECLAAKGGTLCARVGSNKGIVECTSARKGKAAVGESPWLLRGTTGIWTLEIWEAVGVFIQWERAEMTVY
jgi:hypothetical protein